MPFSLLRAPQYLRYSLTLANYFFKSRVTKVGFERSVYLFRKYNGERLRFDYELGPDSLIFDVGGYRGDFASEIYKRYQSRIWIFEPVLEFHMLMSDRFNDNKNIKLFNVALDRETKKSRISIGMDRSSYERDLGSGNFEEIQLKNVADFCEENQVQQIDLIKINIEGAEYDLLDKLLESGIHRIIRNFQIQFHDFAPLAEKRREDIRKKLTETHILRWDFPFVWESWEIKTK